MIYQGIGNRIPVEYNMSDKQRGGRILSNIASRTIVRKGFLGGLLKSYNRAA